MYLEAEAKGRDLVECLRLIKKGGGMKGLGVRENKDFAMHRSRGRVGPSIQLFPNMYAHYNSPPIYNLPAKGHKQLTV